jgi:glycerol-3-phosphate O-acyltransferase
MLKKTFKNFKAKIDGCLQTALKGSHDHYLCVVPERTGSFSGWMRRRFFSGIRMTREDTAILDTLPKAAVVIFVNRRKNKFEYLFYHTRYAQLGLPVPVIGFDYKVFGCQPLSRLFRILLSKIDHFFRHLRLANPYTDGYLEKQLGAGKKAMLSLVESHGFYRRFVKAERDPVRFLLEMQERTDRPIYLVPHLLFFGRTPHRAIPSLVDILLGDLENPGWIRRLILLFKSSDKIFVELSQPVNLQEFIAEHPEPNIENQTLALRRHLMVQFNRHRQSITGPVLKSREELIENILTNERLQTFMAHQARVRELSLQKVRKEASDCLDEIMARYNPAAISIFSTILGWIFNSMFDGVSLDPQELARLKAMSLKGPLVLIPCHKSHIDYLILSYILYNNNMPCPHIAAGKNLSFWPMGPIFRAGGAFFIRRSFKGAVLYSKVFSEYMYKLLEEGFNIEFFIEGGRSRTGKLLQPKLGLLSILLNAFREGACEDLIVAPIFIGYDRILEENAYQHELEGGAKARENLFQVIKARKFLTKRYGKIYIRIHEPLSLAELLADTPLEQMTSKAQNVFCRNLGHRVVNAIDRISVVTPHALAASALLNSPKANVGHGQMMAQIETYLTHLSTQGVKLSDTLLIDPFGAVDRVIEDYLGQKFIERITAEKDAPVPETRYKINDAKRQILDYYKNISMIFFIPAIYTTLAILKRDAFQFSASDLHADYRFLQELFALEFAADLDKSPEFFVRKTIKAFIDDAILMPHPSLPDTYNLTSAGFRKLKFFSAFLKPYFESYWVALNFFMHKEKSSVTVKDRPKKILAMGARMHKRNEIELREALNRITFSNAADFFTSHGVRGFEDTEPIEFYSGTFQAYMKHL